jgi:IclR family mhp operon transcriptional activator
MSILQAVNRSGSLSMMEIAQVTAIPYPTTRRIVTTLVVAGMLEQEPARKHYRPTVLVQSLAHGFQDHSGLTDIARPYLVGLTKTHLWPVSLSTRVGQSMIVRDCTHAMSPIAMNNYYPGATFPLLECASGHVYLAYTDEAERDRLVKAAASTEGPPDPLVIQQFQSGFLPEEIRKVGYATRGRNRFTTTPGRTSSISAPILCEGRVVATLTIVIFATAMKMSDAIARYTPDLLSAATQIGREFAEHQSGLHAA